MKFLISKVTGDAEQINAEIEIPNDSDDGHIRHLVEKATDVVDERLMVSNIRLMVMRFLAQTMPVEVQMHLHTLMEVLHGAQLSDASYAGILQESITKVTEKLIEANIPRKEIDRAVKAAYGERDSGKGRHKNGMHVVKGGRDGSK